MRMNSIKISHLLGLLVVLAILVGGVLYMLRSDDTADVPQPKSPSQRAHAAETAYVPGLPFRIIIPKINVNASIDSLGLTPEGDLGAPDEIANAGWYNAGPRVGSPGSAVIDGHFGGTASKPAVFDKLHTLQIGDIVNVEDTDKKIHAFVVREKQLFQPDEDASTVFRSHDNKAHLNLITCQGVWINRQETYSSRLVVFTDLLTD